MQITKAEVTPVELALKQPVQMAHLPELKSVTAVFVRLETRQGQSAWGCTVTHPQLTGDEPQDVLRACYACAAKAPDLHPTNIEYSLGELANLVHEAPSALCALVPLRPVAPEERGQGERVRPAARRVPGPNPDLDHRTDRIRAGKCGDG